jgi:hypothetical protein
MFRKLVNFRPSHQVGGWSRPTRCSRTEARLQVDRLEDRWLLSLLTSTPSGHVEIDINDTPGKSDNITLFNSAPSNQAYAQMIPAKITNLSGAEGTFHLSVNPSGAASLSENAVDLAAGESTEIIITPRADSAAPNDVHLIAMQGNTQVGEDDMTIVSVTIPQDIRNADTPTAMVDRIPPRVDTPIPIQVTPSLSGSGLSVTLVVLNQDENHGSITLDGLDRDIVTSSRTVNFRGVGQTAPTEGFSAGNAGQLKLVVQVRGTDTVQSNGFSVVAIPENWTDVFLSKDKGKRRGFKVQDGWSSDSGDPLDLDAVDISEEIETAAATGVFARRGRRILTSGYLSATIPSSDDHSVPLSWVRKPGGTLTLNQTSVFRDRRTGSVGIPVTNSGYLIMHTAFRDPRTGRMEITTTKQGDAVTADGFFSSAGAGFITLTQKGRSSQAIG